MADKSKAILAALTGAIKSYGKIIGERNRLNAEVLANELEKRSNFLWKMKERMASPEWRIQKQLEKMYEQQQGGGQVTGNLGTAIRPSQVGQPSQPGQQPALTGTVFPGMAPGTMVVPGPGGRMIAGKTDKYLYPEATIPARAEPDIFGEQIKPEVRLSAGGYRLHYPTQKEFIYKRIQEKKQQGMPLSKAERKFEENYLGLKEKPLGVEEYDLDKRKALSGEMEWAELRNKYAYDASRLAEISKIQTQDLINQIMNHPDGWKAGFKEFRQREREASMAGINVADVYKAFGYDY